MGTRPDLDLGGVLFLVVERLTVDLGPGDPQQSRPEAEPSLTVTGQSRPSFSFR